MTVRVTFWSYFKELAGTSETSVELPEGSRISDLLRRVFDQFPKLHGAENSVLVAVGVEYQPRDYILRNGDQVSLFPPVQGG